MELYKVLKIIIIGIFFFGDGGDIILYIFFVKYN